MKRAVYYFILILSAFMLQNNFFAAVKLLASTPNLLLIVTFTIAFLNGRKDGMIVGFCCGLVSDLFFSTNVGVYALIYTLIGYGCGIIGQLFYTEYLYMPVLLCLGSELGFGLYVFVAYFLLNGTTDIGYYMLNIILPEMVYTLLITLITYKPLHILNDWVKKKEKKIAKKYV